MGIAFGLLSDNVVNTFHAPLAALSAHYQQNSTFKALEAVELGMKTVEYTPSSKLSQVCLSILAGCEYLVEVNTCLRPDTTLAQVWGLARFADQSVLSRTLDQLTLTNIGQLRGGVTSIWRQHSQVSGHDWRGFLWLDFDLSGLPCGAQAQASTKGYFSGKKT